MPMLVVMSGSILTDRLWLLAGAAGIIVRGEDGSWERTPSPAAGPDPDSKQVLGKQQHLRSCCDEVARRSGHRPTSLEGASTGSPPLPRSAHLARFLTAVSVLRACARLQ